MICIVSFKISYTISTIHTCNARVAKLVDNNKGETRHNKGTKIKMEEKNIK